VASTFPAILIGTDDDDLDRIKALIEEAAANEIFRADAFDALAWLTAAGQVPREAAADYLRELHRPMRPQGMSFAWFGWQKAIALLGLEDLRPLVADAFERGFVDLSVMVSRGTAHPCG
jgi:hypothetical protein